MAPTVLVTDAVDPVCTELLERAGFEVAVHLKTSPEELKALAAQAHGWIIRSGTQVTAELLEAAEHLQVVGRAGVGVDNVDLDAATRRGVLVINAPDGNTISTAEHACAMLMALARRIPQANASLVSGKWERKAFTGSELYEKTIGIVGVGKIGQAVAERLRAFGVTLLGYDPLLSAERAERLGVRLVPLAELLAQSDYITIHAPLNDATRGLLGAETLRQCKPGVGIVNCARGGIVDEQALLEALEEGHVGGAALDVYSQEPPPPALEALIRHPRVVATPHIAASTGEAQTKVAEQVTEQVIRALQGEPVQTAVNGLAIRMAGQREVQPYLRLADALGRVAVQLSDRPLERITVRCSGDVPRRYAEVLTVAAVRGVLSRLRSGPVNLINAPVLAEEMGLHVEEQSHTAQGPYTSLVEVVLSGGGDDRLVAGTLFAADDPRLVRVDTYHRLEVRPEGVLLSYRNEDRPGMLAAVGGMLAEAGINIGALALGRRERGARALTVINVDDVVPENVLKHISALDGVSDVRLIHL